MGEKGDMRNLENLINKIMNEAVNHKVKSIAFSDLYKGMP